MSRKLSLAWAAVPLLVYLVVLSRLWANAPVWDDYGTVLDTLTRMSDSKSAREWLALLVHQHNEHRIFTVRLVTRAVEALPGPLDFRLLVLLGNAAFVGVFLLAWAQFRESLVGPVVAAAAFVMFQLSYYEAGLWASGGLTNMGAIFFSFAALAVALRPGARAAAACLALATLAIGCSASGLLVLPIAAAGAALQRRTARAAVFAGVAALLWLLYFQGYVKPLHHPSPTVAFSVPLDTMRLFLIVLGSIVPGRDEAQWAGAVLLGAVAALAWKGAWRPHPVAMLWIAFLLLSAAAAAAGRVGFGVFYASRYAIYSTLEPRDARRRRGRGRFAIPGGFLRELARRACLRIARAPPREGPPAGLGARAGALFRHLLSQPPLCDHGAASRRDPGHLHSA